MSTEERLKRLGLYHLKDNPEALRKALEELEQQAREREQREKEAQEKNILQKNRTIQEKKTVQVKTRSSSRLRER